MPPTVAAAYLPDHPFAAEAAGPPPGRPVAAAAWAGVDTHPLSSPGGGGPPAEPGRVRFGWCAAGLLARFEFADAEVCTSASADNQLHYELGDTAEWFLKPADADHYWEFYATPHGHRTAMCWTGPDRSGDVPYEPLDGVRVASATTGDGWVSDLLVPAPLLCSRGDAWGPGSAWTTLAARYDHAAAGRPALSCFPRLPVADFHRTRDFAALTLQAASGERPGPASADPESPGSCVP
ncbi:DOMON domain-containing protein [Phycisphaera mikurensis]|uniref:Carbohydrate-binding domain-containing protein n=1 Tax=Phycisphaera mikurensis (strain NBRC 102666 / KCTC 22515 / FYK2301M01) TaxID=1142394 RepID=I0ICN4_PHYMF|nr:hypothetical protein [Phycisphaera mikurensis]MBB6442103.1 hypothetical protein [Phycisphaera mikurensis]BAM03022.1 hypothetical protein PSMK_08630 [Phycisphaera mikurensis NBRC 102666]